MSFTHPEQSKQLATPTYKIQEKKSKSDALVEPSQVTVVGLIDLNLSVASSAILCMYVCIYFILSTISPCTTGLKALFNQSNCTGTAQLTSN